MVKNKKEEVELQYVNIVTIGRSHVTRECNQDDQWDRDDTSTDWDILGIELGNDGYRTIPVSFPIKEDKEYYLLYTIWSTGDSFGRDDGSQFDGIALYIDKNKAYEAEKLIRNHANLYREYSSSYSRPKNKKPKDFQDYTVNIKLEDGTILPVGAGWNGYFESLDTVDVQVVSLTRRRNEKTYY